MQQSYLMSLHPVKSQMQEITSGLLSSKLQNVPEHSHYTTHLDIMH